MNLKDLQSLMIFIFMIFNRVIGCFAILETVVYLDEKIHDSYLVKMICYYLAYLF